MPAPFSIPPPRSSDTCPALQRGDANFYTNFLPGIQARYTTLDNRLVLRASVTEAISRPPPGDLIPSRQENAQLNQRIIGKSQS